MIDPNTLLYLSRADIESLALTADEVESAIEGAYRGLHEGGAASVPKSGFDTTPATFFHAMPARYDAMETVGIKWIGTAPNAALGLPHINALIVLSDLKTAVVRAVMDGIAITAVRPAAVSLVAARRLARRDSSRISFVACGVQALAHLNVFAAAFPIRHVTCHSRRAESAQAFAATVRERGFDATVVTDPRAAIDGQDIIVSSVPRAVGLVPTLDPAWLSPGSFASAADLGRSWRCAGLRKLDLLATDNRIQSREAAASGVLPWSGEYDTELSELAADAHPGRTTPAQRAFFIHPGLGLGDIAIAALAFRRAQELGIGTLLPR